MDDVLSDFFDFSKDFQRIDGPKGEIANDPRTVADDEEFKENKPKKRPCLGNRYAEDPVEAEHERLRTMDIPFGEEAMEVCSNHNSLDDLDDLESVSNQDFRISEFYTPPQEYDYQLPVYEKREQILDAIRRKPVVVLEGDTGCGKTTQVPQFILDNAVERREYCKIVCTQPRRIAAMSIAERVSNERNWNVGSVVGYQVGLHAKLSPETHILYCTTGVLLQKLIREKSLEQFTHIILDEVHERDQEMDFLLIVVRKLLTKNTKIVLMSATIDSKLFSDYFRIRDKPAMIVSVDRRRFHVQEHYLCDLGRINAAHLEVSPEEPGISDEMYRACLKLIVVIDNIEKKECEQLCAASLNEERPTTNYKKCSILIFLPGINEIDQLYDRIFMLNNSSTDESFMKLYPIRLHSMIPPDEQYKVFLPPPLNLRKVILATNIAESSITVPDVKYVIDFCLTKSVLTDSSTNFTSLQLQWASKANCRQRAGRAGRLQSGRVYRLVPKIFYQSFMPDFATPEIVRCPLEYAVLKAKLLDLGAPPKILALALTPPDLSDINNTILSLKELGGLYLTASKVYREDDGDLTLIGRFMANLPLDVRLSRLIVLGYMFSVVEEAIIIAAGLSVRSIFLYHSNNHNNSDRNELECHFQKLIWADGSSSDLFAILKVYKTWLQMRQQTTIVSSSGERNWAQRYFINLRSLKEMHLLVQDLTQRVENMNVLQMREHLRVFWVEREKTIILKTIIAGAFYPNYFVRTNLNDVSRERDIYHILNGNDPCTTVYFTNFGTRHIGQVYTHAIKHIFREIEPNPSNLEVRFQPGSERVFVTFTKESSLNALINSKVCPELLRAVRLRNIRRSHKISVMDPCHEIEWAEKHGGGTMVAGVWKPALKNPIDYDAVVLPSIFQKTVRGNIQHIESCGKFFFQPLTEVERMREIGSILNDDEDVHNGRFSHASNIYRGMILAAPYEDKYHRAKVLHPVQSARHCAQFKVLFIDFGNTKVVDFEELRSFSKKSEHLVTLPPRVFECRLASVEPSTIKSATGTWPEEAMEYMQEIADAGIVELEIYSLYLGIANVILKIGHSSLNDLLVEKGFAHRIDENYMSKMDHAYRMRKQAVVNRFLDDESMRQNEDYLRTILPEEYVEIPPPPRGMSIFRDISLRGPFSPLETTFNAAIRVGTWKSVSVERESVNNVMLDTDPQNKHERLLVAAAVSEDPSRQRLVARGTTLMPNIHGFGAMMTLLFAPTIQIKCNREHTKYVTLLAGLGYDKTQKNRDGSYKALFEEHDIVMSLDADFVNHDISLISQIRYCMETLIYTDITEEFPSIMPQQRADMAAKIKTLIIRLFNKNRRCIETHTGPNDHVWEAINPEDLNTNIDHFADRSVFRAIEAHRLFEDKFDQIHALTQHCDELHRNSQYENHTEPLHCLLCNQSFQDVIELRIHLLSKLHLDREAQICYKPK